MLRINVSYEPLGLPTLIKLNESRVRIIVAMCSYISVDGDLAHQCFNKILNKAQSDERNIVLDANSVASRQLSVLYEWSQIVLAKFVAGNNMTLLVKLRRDMSSHCPQTYGDSGSTRFDTLTVPRLFEHLHPTRCAIFTPSSGVFLPACDNHLLEELI